MVLGKGDLVVSQSPSKKEIVENFPGMVGVAGQSLKIVLRATGRGRRLKEWLQSHGRGFSECQSVRSVERSGLEFPAKNHVVMFALENLVQFAGVDNKLALVRDIKG